MPPDTVPGPLPRACVDPASTAPLLDAARVVAAIAARHAAASDVRRRLHPEVVEALVEAGFAAHFAPTRWAGRAGSFGELTAAVAVVGEGCASAAWTASLWAYTARFAAYLPAEGQAEIWEKGPDTCVVSALAPTGDVRAVPGGWQLSGRWPYTSGVDFSDWALVRGPGVPGGDPGRFFALPRDAYDIQDTWHNVGMRATGSNTLVVEDVFVPEQRSFLVADMVGGQGSDSPARCHNVPLLAVNGLTFAAPVLGSARGALVSSARWLADKQDVHGRPVGRSPAVQTAVARAAGEIDIAEMLLGRIAAGADDDAVVTGAQVARNGRDAALAVELMTSAVDRLFRSGGTRAQSDSHPLQRAWRDVHAAGSHVALQFDSGAEAFVNHLLASV
ncbi:acyl-CoA dehydrogenase family protein [Streptodolium elevatio]|uniref:Acyl-CoA dehydrogenase family protein n=1 Tax=Streptodolium elevatio TaxID=3157996 RepID=A0ABV3DPP6_9ACTN